MYAAGGWAWPSLNQKKAPPPACEEPPPIPLWPLHSTRPGGRAIS
jgi:hypothetical protein